ncbi:hypothetical protein [Nocardia farcinica]|uniref:hypothetical protein n=1 Tax=Nocardia farcinica TaxID=37329 RepID=UPI001895F7AD|nr:hypothetical protein [Nocardia farcinica]MBF6519748.1 hypothetical protein [Nocardia farcinica]
MKLPPSNMQGSRRADDGVPLHMIAVVIRQGTVATTYRHMIRKAGGRHPVGRSMGQRMSGPAAGPGRLTVRLIRANKKALTMWTGQGLLGVSTNTSG